MLRAGRKIREWIGYDVRNKQIADLPRDFAIALGAVVAQSIEASGPVPYRAHRVAEGMVETYEMLAFPMACRWGQSLVGVYVAEAGTRYNLVDTIFRSTNEGILALAAIRNTSGAATDFQIVAVNHGAAELLGVDENTCSGAGFRSCHWDHPPWAFATVSLPASGREGSISSNSPLSAGTVKSM